MAVSGPLVKTLHSGEHGRMTAWWLLMSGILIGIVVMVPIVWLWLRRLERRVRDAERRAHDSERLAELGAMTGGLAHEIKNPLSTIGLNAQLLGEVINESDLPAMHRERMQRRLETLVREIERLRGILSDFLQFAGRIKLDPQPRDLVKIVDELSDFFHPQCDQAGVTLRTQTSQGITRALTVEVDEALMKQAVLNLMLNAVQAMTEGAEAGSSQHKELILRMEADDREARIHVIDTGPGIEPAKLNEIFRPYVSMRAGGTGLGLPTARRIIQEHGGRVEVHTEPGRGSDFVIHLPRRI